MRKLLCVTVFTYIAILLCPCEPLFAQNKETLKQQVFTLSADDMQGRPVGGEADARAAGYILGQMLKAGLKPMAENGFQHFNLIASVEPGDNNSLQICDEQLVYGQHYSLYAFSASVNTTAPVVFAGFGIVMQNDTLARDDYKDLDVKGKWVLVLRGDPMPERNDSPFIPYSDARTKAMLARDRGAVGLIVTSGKRNNAQDDLAPLIFERSVSDAGIPVIDLRRSAADRFLLPEGYTADSLEANAIKGHYHAMSFPCTISATTHLLKKSVQTQNVMAALTSPSASDEWLVIGAHYDHLGMGGPGSGSRMPETPAIHYGADDNASGVAGMLWLAEKLTTHRSKLKRNVLFVAFGAEELGLVGSKHFVRNMPFPKEKVVAMINLDMIGRLNERQSLMAGGTGTSSVWEALLNRLNEEAGLSLSFSSEGFGASDHASFYAEGIPVLFFTTGAHSDYHTPNDTPDKINFEGMQQVLGLIGAVSLELATSDGRPDFREAGPRERVASRRGFRVTFGIMPGFADTGGNGLNVDGVTKGGPADLAGMKKGDRITGINGLAVKDIYDYMNRLKTIKPGERVNVDIVRNNEPLILVVEL
ncbi:MAG TPA: M20/M25/M40 family metallo-hydrolase [Bacteroidales bacterium]|nr:M20/M25/M40 family metallo-hydrolase [Bacteroidales bacterium]